MSERRLSCSEVHPQQDIYHPGGHPPVSPLATVREALEKMLVIGRALGVEKHGVEIEDALAVLDSLDGTITLTVEEAEKIESGLRLAKRADRVALAALLATRIEESK